MHDSTIHAKQAVTRFLLPFRFGQDKLEGVRRALMESHWCEQAPNRNYRTDFDSDFLARCFGRTAQEAAGRSNLFQWDVNRAEKKPGQAFNVTFKKETMRAALWNQDGRDIELFLADQGVGVVSITLCLAEARDEAQLIPLARIKSFNYSLCQDTSRKRSSALMAKADGEPYEPISLKGFVEELLEPIRREEFQWRPLGETAQLIPYTVIRFPGEYSFHSLEAPANLPRANDLAAQASLLAQVGEAPHPLPIREDPGAIVRIFHSDELFAVSSMGAAVLLADLGTQFDQQKLQDRLDKYFVCFLAALSQRLRLRQLLEDASKLAGMRAGRERDLELEKLRSRMLATASRSELIEVSTRDTVNRFFSQCQQAQRVPQALALVQQTIADMDASLQAEKQGAIAAEMAATQTKVEWIEIFLISFYAAELVSMLGREFHLARGYLSTCVLAAMFGGGIISALMLKPWDSDKHTGARPPAGFRNAVVLIGLVLAAFLFAGTRYFPERDPVDESAALRESWRKTQSELHDLTAAIQAQMRVEEEARKKGEATKGKTKK